MRIIPSGATGNGSQQVSCNGLYDPTPAIGGGQPLYFDQIMALYNHYVCTSSKLTVTVSDAVNRQSTVAVYIDDDINQDNNAVSAASRPDAQSRSGYLAQVGGWTFTKTWNAKEYFGGNPLSKNELSGDASSNPNEQSFYTIATKDHNTTLNDYYAFIKVEYTCMFDELKTIPIS